MILMRQRLSTSLVSGLKFCSLNCCILFDYSIIPVVTAQPRDENKMQGYDLRGFMWVVVLNVWVYQTSEICIYRHLLYALLIVYSIYI